MSAGDPGAGAPFGSQFDGQLADFLGRQRWFRGGPSRAAGARIRRAEPIVAGSPALWLLLVEAGGSTYQVLAGVRYAEGSEDVLEGHDPAVLGLFDEAGVPAVAYDALIDPELSRFLLEYVTGLKSELVRPVGAEQSNSSLIFDDRTILKVFRRLQRGPNPDVEVSLALDEVGFNHLAAPLGHWWLEDEDLYLAFAQEYLADGTEGWAMGLTSLRDLLAQSEDGVALDDARLAREGSPALSSRETPDRDERRYEEFAASAGGDFGSESARLGTMTASMHLALAEAFGSSPADATVWSRSVADQLAALSARIRSMETLQPGAPSGLALERLGDLPERAAPLLALLAGVPDPGLVTRVHGDYHLGQVMRSDVGWIVLDFEGEPSRSLAERREPTSPLKDVAGMIRSLGYAADVALDERGEHNGHTAALATGWTSRNRREFWDAYRSRAGIDALLPESPGTRELVVEAFELEKAAYELGYELDHRPSWARFPAAALERLLLRWA